MNAKEDQIYHKLRAEIDKMPYGMPKTESGIEIRILKQLFTPREALIASHLNVIGERPKAIHKRVRKTIKDISLEQLTEVLENLSKRGMILPNWRGGKRVYGLALLAIGIFEFQVDRMSPEFYEECEAYLDAFKEEYYRYSSPQLRTVPIGKSIGVEHNVATYDDMRKTIEKIEGQFVVANCVCRQGEELVGRKCKRTDLEETCILFPEAGWRYLEFGTGRPVSKEEVLSILERAEDAGLVIQPSNAKRPMNICCCCGCCCGALRMAKRMDKPAERFSTNYRAVVDVDSCSGCKICVKRCPMDAVTVVDKKAIIDNDRCIGCGLCVPKCKESSMKLIRKEKEIVPPPTMDMYFGKIMLKKQGVAGATKTLLKNMTGRKV